MKEFVQTGTIKPVREQDVFGASKSVIDAAEVFLAKSDVKNDVELLEEQIKIGTNREDLNDFKLNLAKTIVRLKPVIILSEDTELKKLQERSEKLLK